VRILSVLVHVRNGNFFGTYMMINTKNFNSNKNVKNNRGLVINNKNMLLEIEIDYHVINDVASFQKHYIGCQNKHETHLF
jgi:hypothetical protein